MLHAFTHIFGILLVPLYILMQKDLGLNGVGPAARIVTISGMVYCLCGYAAGVLADRFNRKAILGIGLIGNALAIGLMGLTRQYELLMLLGVLAGVFGALFHPAGAALAPAHYPDNPGMAIGILGSGSGMGFFLGFQYAGWRAQHATSFASISVANWQVPCVEMGLVGVLAGILFLVLAREAPRAPKAAHQPHPPMGSHVRWRILIIATLLAGRDFAGIGLLSLASIYLQKSMGRTVQQTGLMLATMTLIGVVANPLAVWLTSGKRRLPGLVLILLLAAIAVTVVPWLGGTWLLPLFILFETMQLGSYAVADAAILERVSPEIRGRVMGLFLTAAGTLAATAPWLMGFWTDHLLHPDKQAAYAGPFALLGACLALSTLAIPLIARLGPARVGAIRVANELPTPSSQETGCTAAAE